MTLETLTSGIGHLPTCRACSPTAGNVSLYATRGRYRSASTPAGVTITAPTVEIVTTSFTVNGAQFTVT